MKTWQYESSDATALKSFSTNSQDLAWIFSRKWTPETRERSPCVTEGVDKDAINSGLKYVNNIPWIRVYRIINDESLDFNTT